MRQFKYVGSIKQTGEYGAVRPVVGDIYSEDDKIGGREVKYWAECTSSKTRAEWEEVFEGIPSPVCDDYRIHKTNYLGCSMTIIDLNGKDFNINFGSDDI